MNVQRGIGGKLRMAEFRSVLQLPTPVLRVVRITSFVTDDPWAIQSHRIHRQVYDTETTDFHGQRMSIVR